MTPSTKTAPPRCSDLYSYSYGLYICGLDSYGLYSYDLYSHGLYSYGLDSYGLYSYELYSHGLYSYGLDSYGLDIYGLYSYGRGAATSRRRSAPTTSGP